MDKTDAPNILNAHLSLSSSDKAVVLSADAVVVGLGAGGGMAFHDMALAGIDVLGLEAGSYITTEQMTGREEQMLPQLFAEGGARATEDFGISILQGRGVGGSTLHNTNLCKRLPPKILDEWASVYGLDNLLSREFQNDFNAVETLLNVHPVPDILVNKNNQVLRRGAEKLGYTHGRLKHNRKECRQSGLCEVGCPNNGKENVAKRLIPPALNAGGRLLTDARVDKIIVQNGTAVGVQGHIVSSIAHGKTATKPLVVHAKRVVLAASATASAAIVKRSGLPDPHQLAATNLHLHPGAFVTGIFDQPIQGWLGIPQSIDCTQFLEHGQNARHRVWIVSGFAHPGAASSFVPGFGVPHAKLMKQYPNMAVVIVMLHDKVSGRIQPGNGEKVHIFYKLNREEYKQLAYGLRIAGKILLAAGAKKVIIPTAPPFFASTNTQMDQLTTQQLGPLSPPLTAVHPMSTLWMGNNPRKAVVNSQGEYYHTKNLYITDGSLFPTSIGGPPQIPIYAISKYITRGIIQSM